MNEEGEEPAASVTLRKHGENASQARAERAHHARFRAGGWTSPVCTFPIRMLALVGYLLLIVPVVVFFFGWLRWYYAVAATFVLAAGLVWLYRTDYLKDTAVLEVPVLHLVLAMTVIGVYVAASGNCGLSWGGYDIPWRNVMLTDLIDHEWPVVFDNGYALAYYFAFWLVPALVGKACGFGAAFFALWLEQVLVMGVALLLMAHLIDVRTPAQLWMVLAVFLLWSGVNLVGAAFSQIAGFDGYQMDMSYNENYSGRFYYRSNLDCIEETYNQIVVWLAVPLMLHNRRMNSYLFLGLLLLPYSPWLTVGIVVFMVVLAIVEARELCRGKRWWSAMLATLREVASPANIAAACSLGIVFIAFFAASLYAPASADAATEAAAAAASASASATGTGVAGILDVSSFSLFKWVGFLVFAFCEYGIYALFLFRSRRHDPLYWTTVIWLTVAPFFWVGAFEGVDFGMDATLPGLAVLMVLMMGYCKDEVMGKALGLRNLLFVVVASIVVLGQCMQLAYQVEMLYENQTFYDVRDSYQITSYGDKPLDSVSNFVCGAPDDTFFFSELTR